MNSPFAPRPSVKRIHPLHRNRVVRGNHTNSNLAAQDAASSHRESLSFPLFQPWVLVGKLYPSTLQFVLVESRDKAVA